MLCTVKERLVHALRRIAAASGLKIHQRGVNGVEIVRQIDYPGDVLITTVTIGNQANPDLRRRLG